MKAVRFEPDRLEVQAGEPVRLLAKNKDFTLHTFTIEELGIDYTFKPRSELVFALPALAVGEFSYICTVPGHEKMTGTLVVSR